MLPLPMPSLNPMNPFGLVSSGVATAATVAGLGAGLVLGAALLAAGAMLTPRR
ncbi:MAG TPA: hypothetical protein VEH84_13305 [Alphaproteobacteria bacterium]|nr:hypothetical protein [Alphaproteobacteria bacterium]